MLISSFISHCANSHQHTFKQWLLGFSQLEAPESQRSQGLIHNHYLGYRVFSVPEHITLNTSKISNPLRTCFNSSWQHKEAQILKAYAINHIPHILLILKFLGWTLTTQKSHTQNSNVVLCDHRQQTFLVHHHTMLVVYRAETLVILWSGAK